MPQIIFNSNTLAPNQPWGDTARASGYASHIRANQRMLMRTFDVSTTMIPSHSVFVRQWNTQLTDSGSIMIEVSSSREIDTRNALSVVSPFGFVRPICARSVPKYILLQAAFNAVSLVKAAHNNRVHYKVDYLAVVPHRYRSQCELMPIFNDRTVLEMPDTVYNRLCELLHSLLGTLTVAERIRTTTGFWDEIFAIYNDRFPYNYNLANPAYLRPNEGRRARRTSTSRRGVAPAGVIDYPNVVVPSLRRGGHSGPRPNYNPDLDVPRGQLAREYTSRRDSAESFSREEMIHFIQNSPVPPRIWDILFEGFSPDDLYDLIIENSIGQEIPEPSVNR